MVDVCVCEYEIVNASWVESQISVHGVCLQSFALIHAAIQQQPRGGAVGARYFQQVLAASDGAGRAVEGD